MVLHTSRNSCCSKKAHSTDCCLLSAWRNLFTSMVARVRCVTKAIMRGGNGCWIHLKDKHCRKENCLLCHVFDSDLLPPSLSSLLHPHLSLLYSRTMKTASFYKISGLLIRGRTCFSDTPEGRGSWRNWNKSPILPLSQFASMALFSIWVRLGQRTGSQLYTIFPMC